MMRNSLLITFVLSLLVGCAGSSSPESEANLVDEELSINLAEVLDYQLQNTNSLLEEVDSRLEGLTLLEFFDESFKIIEENNHESILASGRTAEFDIANYQLKNISDEFYFQLVAVKSRILQSLNSYDRSQLSSDDQLSYDVYQSYLEFEVEWAGYRNFEYPATYSFFGWPGATESLFTEVLQITSANDAQIYLDLLNQIGRRFEQIEELLNARQSVGIIEPAITLNYSQGQVANMAATPTTSTSYYQYFVQEIDQLDNITTDEKDEFKAVLKLIIEQRVIPAYQSLSQKMSELSSLAPQNIGFGQFEGGQEFYDFTLRYFTSSDMTADEVHLLGLQELERIHSEMRDLFVQLGYPENETIEQLLSRASNDGGIISGAEAVAFYENIIEQAYTKLPQAFSQIPQQQVVVIGGSSGGYYIGGSEDGSRPGAFYASSVSDLSYFTMPTLAYHEAVPGHHMQIALA